MTTWIRLGTIGPGGGGSLAQTTGSGVSSPFYTESRGSSSSLPQQSGGATEGAPAAGTGAAFAPVVAQTTMRATLPTLTAAKKPSQLATPTTFTSQVKSTIPAVYAAANTKPFVGQATASGTPILAQGSQQKQVAADEQARLDRIATQDAEMRAQLRRDFLCAQGIGCPEAQVSTGGGGAEAHQDAVDTTQTTTLDSQADATTVSVAELDARYPDPQLSAAATLPDWWLAEIQAKNANALVAPVATGDQQVPWLWLGLGALGILGVGFGIYTLTR